MRTISRILATLALAACLLACNTNTKPSAEVPATVEGIEITIWEGNEYISWEKSSFVHISPALFDTIAPCDEVFLKFNYVGDDPYPTVGLFNHDWSDLACTGRIPIDSTATEISYFVPNELNKIMHEGGIIVAGVGYNLTKIIIRKHEPANDIDNAIWIGKFMAADDWHLPLNLSKGTFEFASEGDIMRIHLTDVGENAECSLHTGNWRIIKQNIPVAGDNFDVELDEDTLTLLRNEGFTINGVHFGINKIEFIHANNTDSKE